VIRLDGKEVTSMSPAVHYCSPVLHYSSTNCAVLKSAQCRIDTRSSVYIYVKVYSIYFLCVPTVNPLRNHSFNLNRL